MSALADYYAAMANDRNAAAALQRSQAYENPANSEADRAAKYAQASQGTAGANLANTQAKVLPGQADSENLARGASAGLANAQAAAVPAATASEIAQRNVETRNAALTGQGIIPTLQADLAQKSAQTAGALIQNQQQGSLLTPYAPGFGPTLRDAFPNAGLDGGGGFAPSSAPGGAPGGALGLAVHNVTSSVLDPNATYTQDRDPLTGLPKTHLSKGGMVTGKPTKEQAKPNAKDTVPTMLEKGEAVLNKGAVEHVGPSVIAHLNKLGLLRMAAHEEVQNHFKALQGHTLAKLGVTKSSAKSSKAA